MDTPIILDPAIPEPQRSQIQDLIDQMTLLGLQYQMICAAVNAALQVANLSQFAQDCGAEEEEEG
jgi:hypothetical protein